MIRLLLLFITPLVLSSCTYMKYSLVQAEYRRLQEAKPEQVNLKHMIDHQSFFVAGRTVDDAGKFSGHYLAVAAYSCKYKDNERVDTMFFASAGTHFGLTLPEGHYTLLVFADVNGNRIFESSEVVGQMDITLAREEVPHLVVSGLEIQLTAATQVDWAEDIVAPPAVEPKRSLFYPAGAIRALDDPIFDANVSTLGLYDPATFTENAPTMFYALEEDKEYKIAVVFVHGIGGSPRAFSRIIDRLDDRKYKPWFFYYPSGGDLNQLSDLFYQIFLSGEVIRMLRMPMIIVAHSMGGVIVREALNSFKGSPEENNLKLFISIASPFGGHPDAAVGEKYGVLVLPSWRDMNPSSPFITQLFRKPLPEKVRHHLLYAYQDESILKHRENSDGVVPLSSQLTINAQKQSEQQFGFNDNHTGILESEDAIDYVVELVDSIPNYLPDDHLHYYYMGGYDLALGDEYSLDFQYIVRTYGKYWMAVTRGYLTPAFPEQERFLQVLRGEIEPWHDLIAEWIQFLQDNPELDI